MREDFVLGLGLGIKLYWDLLLVFFVLFKVVFGFDFIVIVVNLEDGLDFIIYFCKFVEL